MNDLIPYADITKMASVMGKGKMFGKSPEELLPLMLIAQAEGKHPAIAAQEYDIIQGKPALNSRAALARFQTAGGKIEWKERTDQQATAVFSHPQGGSLSVTWTIDRAIKAGLAGKDNWKKFPAQMLSARVVAEGVRAVFPACLSGMYTVEEVQDIIVPEERNVTTDKDLAEEPKPAPQPKPPKEPTFREKTLAEFKSLFDANGFTEAEITFYRDELKKCGAEEKKLSELLEDAKKCAEAKKTAKPMTPEDEAAADKGFEGAAPETEKKEPAKAEAMPLF